MTPKEKKNRKIAFSIAIGVHLLLLLSWGGVMAWEAPGPPAEFPEVGIVVMQGSDLEGMESENESESENQNEETPEELESEDTPEESNPVDDITEPITDPVDEVQPDETPVDVTDDPSDVVEPDIVETSETQSSTSNNSSEATTSTTSSSSAPKVFQGNGDKAGEQGQEDGVKDVQTYDGNMGGGSLGGTIGDIPGFAWKQKPKLDKVPFDATVKMKVVVNNLGEIITVKFVECPYTDPAVRRKIEEQLKKATLQATSQPDGNTVADIIWAFKGK